MRQMMYPDCKTTLIQNGLRWNHTTFQGAQKEPVSQGGSVPGGSFFNAENVPEAPTEHEFSYLDDGKTTSTFTWWKDSVLNKLCIFVCSHFLIHSRTPGYKCCIIFTSNNNFNSLECNSELRNTNHHPH